MEISEKAMQLLFYYYAILLYYVFLALGRSIENLLAKKLELGHIIINIRSGHAKP